MRLKTWFALLISPPIVLAAVSAVALERNIVAFGNQARAAEIGLIVVAALAIGASLLTTISFAKGVVAPVVNLTRATETLAVTQRQNAAQLHDAEARQQAIVDRLGHLLASGPAVALTFTAGPRPRVTYVSDNVQAHTGFSPRDFVNDPEFLAGLIHPDDRAAFDAGLRHAVDAGTDARILRVRGADGGYRRRQLETRVIVSDNGAPEEIVGWWTDAEAMPVTPRHTLSVSPPPSTLVFDPNAVRAAAGFDDVAVRELLSNFQNDASSHLDRIFIAVAGKQGPELERAAQSLKRAAEAVCGRAVAATALSLERAARRGDLAGAAQITTTLITELAVLSEALSDYPIARGWALAS